MRGILSPKVLFRSKEFVRLHLEQEIDERTATSENVLDFVNIIRRNKLFVGVLVDSLRRLFHGDRRKNGNDGLRQGL